MIARHIDGDERHVKPQGGPAGASDLRSARSTLVDCPDCGGLGDVDEIVGGTIESGPVWRGYTCSACGGTGQVPERCNGCGEPLRIHNAGGWCDYCKHG